MEEKLCEIRKLENCLLEGFGECNISDLGSFDNLDLVQSTLQGQFDKVLHHHLVKEIVKENKDNSYKLDAILEENIQRILKQSVSKCSPHREFEILCIAVAYLQTFVQNNWLGPIDISEDVPILQYIFTDKSKQKELLEYIQGDLGYDGVTVYDLCNGLVYLYVARCVLTILGQHSQQLQTTDWWLMRCIKVHQQILDDKSPTLKNATLDIIDSLSKREPLMTDDRNRDLIIQFHLEAGYLCYTYYEYKAAHDHFNNAQILCNLQVNLTGALGKRTKYQVDSKAQLVLQVSRETTQDKHTAGQEHVTKTDLPKILSLDDDTLLNEICFNDAEIRFAPDLSCVEQAVILGIMENHLKSHAHQEKLTEEEAGAYISCVLSQVKCWSVAEAALIRRSLLEKSSRRSVERSMMQLEELVSQTQKAEPSSRHRLYLFYSVQIFPVWMIQKQLAELLLDIGAVASALEVFERLKLWEDAISCYKTLGKMEKAETVIRDQLAVKETPNLWCFLGDVTREISHYEKAWEMSNHKHARSQRCMGYVYFGKEDYEKSMECFKKSLNINALQIPVWFTYGCTCLAAENMSEAIVAFKRCVMLDADNFEAWNNMASAYVELGDKQKAFKTLQEALKCNYENWRIWDNLLLVATDCGEFEASIEAYHRLMDIKDKWEDLEVLKILVKATTGEYSDSEGLSAERHRVKLQQLFGRITSKVTSNGGIWQLYAELVNSCQEQSTETQQKVLQYLQKAHRCSIQDPHWERTTDKCSEVGNQSIYLADTYLKCSNIASSNQHAIQMLSSAKLMVKGVITKIKREHTDQISGEINEAVKELTDLLEEKLQQLFTKINERKEV